MQYNLYTTLDDRTYSVSDYLRFSQGEYDNRMGLLMSRSADGRPFGEAKAEAHNILRGDAQQEARNILEIVVEEEVWPNFWTPSPDIQLHYDAELINLGRAMFLFCDEDWDLVTDVYGMKAEHPLLYNIASDRYLSVEFSTGKVYEMLIVKKGETVSAPSNNHKFARRINFENSLYDAVKFHHPIVSVQRSIVARQNGGEIPQRPVMTKYHLLVTLLQNKTFGHVPDYHIGLLNDGYRREFWYKMFDVNCWYPKLVTNEETIAA
jgi:hypothetical protein